MEQPQQINIPQNTKIESQPRPKTAKEVVKEKLAEKDKLMRDKKIINK